MTQITSANKTKDTLEINVQMEVYVNQGYVLMESVKGQYLMRIVIMMSIAMLDITATGKNAKCKKTKKQLVQVTTNARIITSVKIIHARNTYKHQQAKNVLPLTLALQIIGVGTVSLRTVKMANV